MAFSPEIHRQIADAYLAGEKCEVIASQFGTDAGTVSRIARMRGIPGRKMRGHKLFSQLELHILRKLLEASPEPVQLSEIHSNKSSLQATVVRLRRKAAPAKIIFNRSVGALVTPANAAIIRSLIAED
jgi:hypothetical protein